MAASVCPPDLKGKTLPASCKPQGAKPDRLLKRADFLAVRRGEKRRGRFFLMEVLDRGDDLAPRVGYTVTKKVGNAVVRNRVRRRLREAVRTHAAAAMSDGHDYVIVGREDVLHADFDAITSELSKRLHRSR